MPPNPEISDAQALGRLLGRQQVVVTLGGAVGCEPDQARGQRGADGRELRKECSNLGRVERIDHPDIVDDVWKGRDDVRRLGQSCRRGSHADRSTRR